jgi:type II secretory pathway component PulK
MPTPTPEPRRGSALILVLWCLILIGLAVFGAVELTSLSVDQAAQDRRALQARALAESGCALGSSPQLLGDDPLLHQTPAANQKMDVTFQSEGARLNLNFVLLSNHREVLVNLFQSWGLEPVAAETAADGMYDWITPGDLRSLHGAKADDYAHAGLPQRPTGQPFLSLDEVAEVMGMDDVAKARPNWRDSFTLWSGGPLDLAQAPAELIAAVLGVPTQRVTYFTEARNGRDGIPGTADDEPIASADTLATALGLDSTTWSQLKSQFSVGDPDRRIKSVGQAGSTRVILSAVVRLNTFPPTYLLWSEQ